MSKKQALEVRTPQGTWLPTWSLYSYPTDARYGLEQDTAVVSHAEKVQSCAKVLKAKVRLPHCYQESDNRKV